MHRMTHRILTLVLALGFILGSFRGYVALFDEGSPEPRQVYPYQIAVLPPVDQAALEKGIPVRNDKQLQHLLEDLLS